MKFFKTKFLGISILLLASSCGMVDQSPATVPAYICVPSYTFVTDTTSNAATYQGANSEKFLDMWISDAGLLVGAVGMPSLLPIQKVGRTEVRIDAGISISGQDEKRTAYPLMETHIEFRDLKPGVIDTFYPAFRYLPNINFKFIEDYDRPGYYMSFNPAYKAQGDTVLKVNDANAWRLNNYAGKVTFTPSASHQIVQLLSGEYELPGLGSPVYLEIDYKSNLPLDIGYYFQDPVTGASPANSVVQTFPNTTWKKLYINLTDEVASRKAGTLYRIYIGIYNIDNLDPQVYIDNIKLVCLKG